jgi:hypothetical protein
MEQDRAEVELSIQIGAETVEELMTILTYARKQLKELIAKPDAQVRVQEDQWCAGAMRVTLRRPHVLSEAQATDPNFNGEKAKENNMVKYATDQSFGGQRASVGRVVVVCLEREEWPTLVPGLIDSIDVVMDQPWIQVMGAVGRLLLQPRYSGAATPAEAEAMPPGTWTWPPRI